MTSNQIAYLSLKETHRHNTVFEQETARHNNASEELIRQQNEETARHNRVVEENALFQLEIQKQQLNETVRSNQEREQISRDQLQETIRHNFGSENLQLRSLLEQERNNLVNNEIGFLNANAALTNAATNAFNAQEAQRHNMAYEDELNRHNIHSEMLTAQQQAEVNRHNIAQENLTNFQVVTGSGNTATSLITQQSQLHETTRHNVTTENLSETNMWLNTATDVLDTYMRRQSDKDRNTTSLLTAGLSAFTKLGGLR